jgi:hypothetical protein
MVGSKVRVIAPCFRAQVRGNNYADRFEIMSSSRNNSRASVATKCSDRAAAIDVCAARGDCLWVFTAGELDRHSLKHKLFVCR